MKIGGGGGVTKSLLEFSSGFLHCSFSLQQAIDQIHHRIDPSGDGFFVEISLRFRKDGVVVMHSVRIDGMGDFVTVAFAPDSNDKRLNLRFVFAPHNAERPVLAPFTAPGIGAELQRIFPVLVNW